MNSMLDAQRKIANGLVTFIRDSAAKGWRPKTATCNSAAARVTTLRFVDRRDLYWRLTGGGASLVYSVKEADVMGHGLTSEDMFVDDAYLVWRPVGENFVVAIVNTGLGDHDVLAVLRPQMERL